MKIIPAIDIIDGKCVRLTQGDYAQKKVYNENPLEVAKEFEAAGITNLHLVDLDGAKASQIINYKVLEKIASQTNLKIDFGGGLKSNEDLKIYEGFDYKSKNNVCIKWLDANLNFFNESDSLCFLSVE